MGLPIYIPSFETWATHDIILIYAVVPNPKYIKQECSVSFDRLTVKRLCRITVQWRKSKKTLFSRVGQRKKSRVAKPRVIFGVPPSETNVFALQTPAQ
jgi:hypothetical protein